MAGTSLNVDFWLRSRVAFDASTEVIQFDFSLSDPALSLTPPFIFDFSSLADSQFYEQHPELPVPWTWNGIGCFCPEAFLTLPAGGTLHVGRVGVQLPSDLGTYHFDALNATAPTSGRGVGGGIIGHWFDYWLASTGDMDGGSLDLVVSIPIPTLSTLGVIVLGLLLVVFGGSVIAARAKRRADGAGHLSFASDAAATDPHDRSRLGLPALWLVVLVLVGPTVVMAQPAEMPSQTVPANCDSGSVSATGTGDDPVLLFSDDIEVPGSP